MNCPEWLQKQPTPMPGVRLSRGEPGRGAAPRLVGHHDGLSRQPEVTPAPQDPSLTSLSK